MENDIREMRRKLEIELSTKEELERDLENKNRQVHEMK